MQISHVLICMLNSRLIQRILTWYDLNCVGNPVFGQYLKTGFKKMEIQFFLQIIYNNISMSFGKKLITLWVTIKMSKLVDNACLWLKKLNSIFFMSLFSGIALYSAKDTLEYFWRGKCAGYPTQLDRFVIEKILDPRPPQMKKNDRAGDTPVCVWVQVPPAQLKK